MVQLLVAPVGVRVVLAQVSELMANSEACAPLNVSAAMLTVPAPVSETVNVLVAVWPSLTGPKFAGEGLTDRVPATPVPVRLTAVVPPACVGSLLGMLRVAVCAPGAVGENASEMAQVAFLARLCPLQPSLEML